MEYKWYVMYVSGNEPQICSQILAKAKQSGLEQYFDQILAPTKDAIDVKRGKKVSVKKKVVPGYLFIHMVLNDDTWHLIKNIPKVSNFLGANNKPQPVSEAEVKRILDQIEQSKVESKYSANFDIGQNVKIIDGPFESFTGTVEEIDNTKSRIKASVTIFGRSTIIDLDFSQVAAT